MNREGKPTRKTTTTVWTDHIPLAIAICLLACRLIVIAALLLAMWSLIARSASAEVWVSADELLDLPTAGPAWESLLGTAGRYSTDTPDLSDQDDKTDSRILAKALVAARTGDDRMADEVRSGIMAAIGTEDGGRTLALGRNLVAIVAAADLVGLPDDDDAQFRSWLSHITQENLDGRTLRSTHEDRPNNWGTHAGASRAAVAAYLGDQRELDRTAQVFKGWVGDVDSYSEFHFGGPYGEEDHSWEHDWSAPVAVNPVGAIIDGWDVGGSLPEEMRRGGPFQWPPEETLYAYEAMQGALVQAEILWRQGYESYLWEDQAILRAFEFLDGIDWQPEGDDVWMTSLVNARYGTDYTEDPWAWHGKNVGWTAWTHQNVAAGAAVPEPGTLLLLVIGSGVSGMVWTIRRRRAS